MTDSTRLVATLDVAGLPSGQLEVVEFSGQDALYRPYAFEILCACRDEAFSGQDMVLRPACLKLESGEGKNAYSGVVSTFHKLQGISGITFYKLSLVPRLRLLELTEHNQVFLGLTIPQILEAVLKECDILNFASRLAASYPQLDYVCQYNESHFHFISRLMEHNGICVFFEEDGDGEKVVLTDTLLSQTPISDHPAAYRQISGLEVEPAPYSISQLTRLDRVVPREVTLKDYNYLRPDIDLLVTVPVDPKGLGTKYHYGDHYRTEAEGRALARIRAEELLCAKTVYHGRGGCLPFRAGRSFTLEGHPDRDFDMTYQIVSVSHSGRTTSELTAGLTLKTGSSERQGYRGSFEAIPAQVQYRPPLATEKTRCHGLISAFIDAQGQGQYAQLDDMGRYKVRLPFDLAGRPDGQASSWLRLAEPYAGQDHGMHFPLLKGTEVLLSFVGGDPDRPVIASTAYNARTPNPLQSQNAPLGVIKTAGQNQIVFNDTEGKEFMGLWSPFHNSGIGIGSIKPGGGGSIGVQTNGDWESFVYGGENKVVMGSSSEVTIGAETKVCGGASTDVIAGLASEIVWGNKLEYFKGSGLAIGDELTEVHTERGVQGLETISMSAGIQPSSRIASEGLQSPFLPLAAMVGTMVAGVAATASSLMLPDTDKASSAKQYFKKNSVDIGLSALAMTSTYALEAVGIWIMNRLLQKKLITLAHHFANECVSTMEMGSAGFEFKAIEKPAGVSNASFSIEVQNQRPNPVTQKVEINKTKGIELIQTNQAASNTLNLDTANNIKLTAVNDITQTATHDLTLTATNNGKFEGQQLLTLQSNAQVKIEVPGTGTITIQNAGITVEKTGGGKAEVTADAAKLSAPNGTHSVSFTNDNIKFSLLNFDAKILKIKAGSIMSLG